MTCPNCKHQETVTMPKMPGGQLYECTRCHTLLSEKPGDCCIYCSYGSRKCPPIQDIRLKLKHSE
ncbi:GDCCVxC domain-containing (seleno)protein [Leucothrix mucor]|uniref:GDCCVxC domain-containing (seleno)protein n=1 Tax=Leucothrix mucor TaxID=45248 RepID=UPI0024807117|nr:GDCCVxC domain-containing (seleno)protein [Leucothrix mucor]